MQLPIVNLLDKLKNQGLKKISFKKFIPGIAWFFVVLVLICLPGSDLPTVDTWLNVIYFDKWIHVGIFCLLAFLFMQPVVRSAFGYAVKLHYCIRIAIATIVWGLTTEFIQKFFIAGRSFDLFDWASDSFGAILAFGFVKIRFLKYK